MNSANGILGKTEEDHAAEITQNSALKVGLVKRVASGGGIAIGSLVGIAIFELMRSDPKDAISLLQSWGWKAILTALVVYVVYDIVKIVLNLVGRLVRSIEKMAVAQQKLADKDDRAVQEMQTLTAYTAQQSEKTYGKIGEVSEHLIRLADRFDAYINAGKKEPS